MLVFVVLFNIRFCWINNKCKLPKTKNDIQVYVDFAQKSELMKTIMIFVPITANYTHLKLSINKQTKKKSALKD